MLDQDGGHVVDLSSVVGRFAMENSSSYMAAKVGVTGFGEAFGMMSPKRGSGFRPSNQVPSIRSYWKTFPTTN
ncbi:SDR family NAD(P)-dependent oxidoreductase [Halegenticoccus tardaugens]|uniref:SDR family NAD(P)-dependent oxidoreductase n=1 Tax=Halegenticoccus tardaugens TaxID=2071624 RepID=UPI0022654FB5|nr:SDR family NAD(P)-dependent oxidoreductase [Halegenticoccus tardaugens]